MITIKSININSIRGIKECDLSPDGKSLIIFGENGTGKSSIVDAIEFFFTGSISHLKSSQSLSMKNHGTHAKSSPSDVSVTLQLNPGGIQITRTFHSDIQIPRMYKDFFDIARKGTFILRRSQIMDFIYSKPAERFRVISRILGIEYLDDIEGAFKKSVDYFSAMLKEKIEAKELILKELSQSLSTEISNSSGILYALNSRIRELGLEMLESSDGLADYISKLSQRLVGSKDPTLSSMLNQISRSSPIIPNQELLMEKLRQVKVGVDILSKEDMVRRLSYSNLLQEGKEMLVQYESTNCPLCGHDINRSDVLDSIDRNILSLDAVSKQAAEIKNNCSYISSEFLRIKSVLDEWHSYLKVYGSDFSEELDSVKDIARGLESLFDNVEGIKNLTLGLNYDSFLAVLDSIVRFDESVVKKVKKIVLRTTDNEDLFSVINILKETEAKYSELQKIEGEISQHKYYHSICEKIVASFSSALKLKIQEIHNSIRTDVEKFYSTLHPGEEHSEIKILIDFTKKRSTNLQVNSYDVMVDPRAFQSEGHLDSLGLCIFLAFIKRFNVECDLVILDDVVTTVDAKHRARICRLLYEDFRDKQMIITTCDNVWYQQLVAHQPRLGVQGKFKNIIIADCSYPLSAAYHVFFLSLVCL